MENISLDFFLLILLLHVIDHISINITVFPQRLIVYIAISLNGIVLFFTEITTDAHR